MTKLTEIIEYNTDLDLIPNGFNHHSGNEDIGHEMADELLKENIKNYFSCDEIKRYKSALEKFPPIFIYYSQKGMRSRLIRIFNALKKEKFPNLDYKNKTTGQLWSYYNQIRRDLGLIPPKKS